VISVDIVDEIVYNAVAHIIYVYTSMQNWQYSDGVWKSTKPFSHIVANFLHGGLV